LERDLSEPDRIVGELLQPGGVAALTELGLGGCLEGIDATPVEGYCVVSGERQVGIPYPDLERMIGEEAEWGEGKGKGKKKETDINGTSNGVANGVANGHANGVSGEKSNGHSMRNIGTSPTWHVPSLSGRKEGRSFHHGRLIMSLRRACLGFGPELVVLEATVRDLVRCEHTGRVIGVAAAFKSAPPPACSAPSSTSISPSAASGDAAGVEAQISTVTSTVVRKVYAPITIIADGCFSKFRSTPGTRIPTPKTRSHFVGVVLKDAQLPLKRHGTVCLTPAGPVLLYQIGDRAEETRMLVDVKGKLPSVADGSLKVGCVGSGLRSLSFRFM
jgi:squalene monooxygenase